MKILTLALVLLFFRPAWATMHEEVDINADVAGTFTLQPKLSPAAAC